VHGTKKSSSLLTKVSVKEVAKSSTLKNTNASFASIGNKNPQSSSSFPSLIWEL
jgi:hypothetical protein